MAAEGLSQREREKVGSIARLAHKLGRHADMFGFVNKLAKMGIELTVDEKRLLIISYRITFSEKHGALRIISVMEEEEEDPKCAECLIFFRNWLEDDMQATCRIVLDVIENHLLPFCRVAENAALYNQMKGDACWFLAMLEEDKEPLVERVLAAYEAASKAAEGMSPAHPQRLALHLTKTAFYHDVMKWDKRAIALGKLAVEEAGPKLGSLDAESEKESIVIVALINENLKLWMSDPKIKDPADEKAPSYFKSSPSPPAVEPRSTAPPMAPDEFTSPGDWGYEVHEGLSPMEIRLRKKAAQVMRGRMG